MEADGQRNGGSELVDGLERPQSPSAENAVLKAAAEKSGSSLIRSHSIAGDLHGLHAPDPVAADVLRKEPEQETYVKLNVSPIGYFVVMADVEKVQPLCGIMDLEVKLEVDQRSNI